MKYIIEAVISTGDYSNITPKFSVETEEEELFAVNKLKELTNRFGKVSLNDKSGGGVKLTTFTGEQIIWNEETHTYTDMNGNVLLSGSKYADMHSPKFDMDQILPKTARSWEVDQSALKDLWKMNSEVSLHWGSAIHKALEIAHNFYAMGEHIQSKKELDNNYTAPKQTHLRRIVQEFIDKYGLGGLPEVLISDVSNGRAGTIDRLEIIDQDKKICRVGDYKTNAEMDSKKKLKYQKQLSFYAHILMAHGWVVKGLDLFYLDEDDHWVKEELGVLELE